VLERVIRRNSKRSAVIRRGAGILLERRMPEAEKAGYLAGM
jgi:hypothetical protein